MPPRVKLPTKRDRSPKGKQVMEEEEEVNLTQHYSAPFPIQTHEEGKRCFQHQQATGAHSSGPTPEDVESEGEEEAEEEEEEEGEAATSEQKGWQQVLARLDSIEIKMDARLDAMDGRLNELGKDVVYHNYKLRKYIELLGLQVPWPTPPQSLASSP